ncbi:hypothetical protein [Frondihabitans cladoniiphilus]|uniref:Uncharacterized protein n=1 Tax=Frondihabitans cladoniiphilus TaxID=715785 RepID=A0ABP8W490_9MICO
MNGSRIPGFPAVGPTIPARTLGLATLLVGLATSWLVIGLSGWLVVALLLTIGATLLPRAPFAVMLVVQLAMALVLTSPTGYTGRFALLLAGTHLLHALGSLAGWLPGGARVQLRVLRRPLVRYVAVQVAAQIVAFVVLTLLARPGAAGAGSAAAAGTGIVWLGVVGAAAALVLGLTLLAPVLLRPARLDLD